MDRIYKINKINKINKIKANTNIDQCD